MLSALPMVSSYYYHQVYAQTVIATIDVGNNPLGVAVNPTTNRIYVANAGDGTVSVIADGLVVVGPPATLTLEPMTDTNEVDSEHCVTATVEDESGNPVPDVTVVFDVTGSNIESGSSVTTNDDGEAEFCYTGQLLGEDAITAFADTNEDGDQDAGEPFDAATKTWTPLASTPGCEVLIDEGGRITAANGDRATFGGNARVSEDGQASGQQQYRDHGPAQPMRVRSTTVNSVPCVIDASGGNGEASIFGTARIDGSGSFQYRIDVDDNGEPGRGRDTYHIQLSNGYDSGVGTLQAGNIQVRQVQTTAGIEAGGGAAPTTTNTTTQQEQPANQLQDPALQGQVDIEDNNTVRNPNCDALLDEVERGLRETVPPDCPTRPIIDTTDEEEETAVEETTATDNDGEEGTQQ
jgi:DNA-binding beta-propeller fold protein YncE